MRKGAVAAALALVLFSGLALLAQERSEKPSRTSPLGVRQQRVERMLDDLERKFKSLSVSLQKTEPERAERLDRTLEEARRLLLSERMGKITELLDQSQLESATSDQKAILVDIRALLEMLLDEQSDRDKAREEYERLAEFKRQIEHVLQQERGEKRQADRLADKGGTLESLAARIKALEALIERQKELIAATEAARGEGIQALGPLVPKQAAIRQQAEAVAAEIAAEAGDKQPAADAPKETPAGDGSRPKADDQPKPTEGSGSEGASSNAPPAAGQPAAGPTSPQSGRPPEPGEKPLQQAIANQQQAEGNLQQGKGKAAQQDEETALANLQRALADLKQESSRIASLPLETFEKLAGKQDDIANRTAQIGDKMKQGSPSGSEGGNSGGEGPEGSQDGGKPVSEGQKPAPGQQKVQQAQQSMQKASGDLRKQDPADASRQQGKAIKDLEEALREIEERLAQLREETQIEKLARLESRFREMLARQQQATADTLRMEKKRQESGGDLKRTDRLAVAKIAAEELSLAEAAQQALDIILDDGTSVVFADVVEQVRDDLQSVARLLDAKQTDTYTTTLQKEIEITLEELIEALQEAQQQKQQGSGGGGGGGGGQEPLLPGSAELKLLRSAQLRINRRTVAIDAARGETTELSDVMKQELQGLAARQEEIGTMTIRILERTAGQ